MTKHTVKVNDYDGQGGGKRIVLTVTLDALTLRLIKLENVDQLVEPLIPDLRRAVRTAAGLADGPGKAGK